MNYVGKITSQLHLEPVLSPHQVHQVQVDSDVYQPPVRMISGTVGEFLKTSNITQLRPGSEEVREDLAVDLEPPVSLLDTVASQETEAVLDVGVALDDDLVALQLGHLLITLPGRNSQLRAVEQEAVLSLPDRPGAVVGARHLPHLVRVLALRQSVADHAGSRVEKLCHHFSLLPSDLSLNTRIRSVINVQD